MWRQETIEAPANDVGAHCAIALDALPSGSYFTRLDFAGAHATRALTLIR